MLTRSQFAVYLSNTFNFITLSGGITFVLQAMLTNHEQMLNVVNVNLNNCVAIIDNYLAEYDAATNDEERMAVIASVVPM